VGRDARRLWRRAPPRRRPPAAASGVKGRTSFYRRSPPTTPRLPIRRGDAGPRGTLWSHDDPVTLFGAEVNRTGWSELEPTFDWLATRLTDCTSLEYEIVSAGASGDLAYLVAIERISAAVALPG
jgi:hypothetical protein